MTSRASVVVSVTKGMANAMTRGRRLARRCPVCNMSIPAYPGRYPSKCPNPKCRADLEEIKEDVITEGVIVCQSKAPRIQGVIDSGTPTTCEAVGAADAVVIPYQKLQGIITDGGVAKFKTFFERADNGKHYRIESPKGPVIIAEFGAASCRIYGTNQPQDVIGYDPRENLIEDGGWDEDGNWTELDESLSSRTDAVILQYAKDNLHRVPSSVRSTIKYALSKVDPKAMAYNWTVGGKMGWGIWQKVNKLGRKRPGGDLAYICDTPSGTLIVTSPGYRTKPYRFVLQVRSNTIYDELIDAGVLDAEKGLLIESVTEAEWRSSMKRPRKPGQGQQRVHGGFRFSIGSRKKKRGSTDVEGTLQRQRAARRREMSPMNVLSKAKRSKEAHRSSKGREMHRRIADLNRTHPDRGKHKRSRRESVKLLRHRARELLARKKAQVAAGIVEDYAASGTGYISSTMMEPTVEDIFENVLRKLIFMESLDVLEDVEFDEWGSLYLFFDPILSRQEVDEIVSMINTERLDTQQDTLLVASPDGSIQEEANPSDWWVAFLPAKTDEGVPAQPDTEKYIPYGDAEPKKQQMVTKAVTTVDRIGMSIDTKKLLKGLGERRRDAAHRWL